MRYITKQMIEVCTFLLLAFEIFVHCSYLFRNTDRVARQNILGLYYEPDNSLDVVFVGSSTVYRYWSPMEAWNSYGFTSYSFGVSKMSSLCSLTAIKEMRKTQSPQLVVVDVRSFTELERISSISSSERNVLDSIDYGINRIQGIKYLYDHSDVSRREIMMEYIELAKYHKNEEALAEKMNWQLIDNRINDSIDRDGFYKGFAIAAKHKYQSESEVQLSDEVADEISDLYVDILKYCEKNDIELLLITSPSVVSESQSQCINKMKLIAQEYGFKFVDGNRYYDEMLLDFTTDFYNKNHVNILGARKWTEFLGNYIMQNYDLPDHRDDSNYESWNILYEMYKRETDEAVRLTKELIQDTSNL